MCKYCEKYSTYFDVDNSFNKPSIAIEAALFIVPYSHPYIRMETTVDAGVFDGINIEGTFEVNYCPICGRKLED